MLAALRRVREGTFAFLNETDGRNLSAYRFSHPFLGSLSFYGWYCALANHEVRHTKQIREIIADLPKVVARSQK